MTGQKTLDDRELPGDKGQLCEGCNVQFKYQYLYDDHLPCRAPRPLDPTTAAIAAQNTERDHLREEVSRLERALVAAYTEIEVVKAERDADRRGRDAAERDRDAELCSQDACVAHAEAERLKKLGDTMFVEGYDQAVREIRDHFAKRRQIDVVAEIDKTWMKEST